MTLEHGGFVFSEWQVYNFWYFLLGSANPLVKLCLIKSDLEPGSVYHEYGRFTDWLISQLKTMVQLRQSLGRLDIQVPVVWAELEQIAQLAD